MAGAAVTAERQGLVDAGVYECVTLQEALLTACGISFRESDEMLIYECAVALGVGREKTTDASKTDFKQHSRDLMRQRLAHSRGLGPKPEARPVDPGMLEQMREMG